MNDAPVHGAAVALQGTDPSDAQDIQTVTTNDSGFFELRDVAAGRPYKVSIRAAGFAEWVSPVVTLDPGQSKILDVNQLRIEEVTTAVTVTPESNDEIANWRHTEEQQRGFKGSSRIFTPSTTQIPRRLRPSLIQSGAQSRQRSIYSGWGSDARRIRTSSEQPRLPPGRRGLRRKVCR